MENIKYYTPELHEFNVGFEYETNYLKNENEWDKVILQQENAGYFFEQYITDASPLEFRVKFLDKEDIEGLGWIVKSFEINMFHLRDFYLKLLDNKVYIFNGLEGDLYYSCLFAGHLKNKSELRKIMVQTGILER